MQIYKYLFLFLTLALVGCPTDGCDTPTIPGDPPPGNGGGTPPPDDPPPDDEPEPPFNPGPMLDLRTAEIASGFALNSRDEHTQRVFIRSLKRRGYTAVRMCIELRYWNEIPTFRGRGPYLWGQEALDAYENTLRVLADEGMSALVMTICSDLRRGGTNEDRLKWVRAIGRRTRGYTNVAFEPNELWHPSSIIRNDHAHIRRLIAAARASSGGLMSGADQNIGTRFASQPHRYRYDNRWRSDFFSFHPWRTTNGRDPDPPNEQDVREIVRQNGGWVVFSETIAYTDNPALADSTWLYTDDKQVIIDLMRACRPYKGCTWTYHFEEGLYADGPITWAPQAF